MLAFYHKCSLPAPALPWKQSIIPIKCILVHNWKTLWRSSQSSSSSLRTDGICCPRDGLPKGKKVGGGGRKKFKVSHWLWKDTWIHYPEVWRHGGANPVPVQPLESPQSPSQAQSAHGLSILSCFKGDSPAVAGKNHSCKSCCSGTDPTRCLPQSFTLRLLPEVFSVLLNPPSSK